MVKLAVHSSSSAPTTLRRRLLVLTAATIVPLLAFATAVVAWTIYNHREAARQRLESTAQALSIATDEQIITWKAALTVLATSQALDNRDYAIFRKRAELVAERFGGWVTLSLPSGQQVVNTSRPVDTDLPYSNPVGLPPSVMREGQAHVSDLFLGPATHRPIIAVTVPAVRDGVVTYALHLGALPSEIADVLTKSGVPAGWLAGIVDRNNRIIARAPYDERVIGMLASDSYIRAVAGGADHGSFGGYALNNIEMYGNFRRLTEAPWTLVLAAPNAELAQAWQRPLIVLACGGALIAIAAAALSLALGRRISEPIHAVARAARAAIMEEAPRPIPESRVSEIAELRSAVIALSQRQILLREVHHRIKNSLQIVSSTLGRLGRSTRNEEVAEEFRQARAHIQAIARLHERLYKTDRQDAVDPVELVRSICADIATLSSGYAAVQIDAAGAAKLDSAKAGPFALAVAELTTNAVKHASQPGQLGRVDIRCRIEDGSMVAVTVSDTGPGLPPDFDLAGQTGFGLRMCLTQTAQIGGTLRSLPASGGAVFELRAPITAAPMQGQP